MRKNRENLPKKARRLIPDDRMIKAQKAGIFSSPAVCFQNGRRRPGARFRGKAVSKETVAAPSLCILIACHKPYALPQGDCYFPVEVGAALHARSIPGCTPDSTGDNISGKNPRYCELTGIYWAWKNLRAGAVGLVHYRRFFTADPLRRYVAGLSDFERLLAKAPVILPKPRHYWIETNYSQYVHAHHAQDLAVTRDVLAEFYPQFLPSYDRQMRRRSGHRFNMFVMRRDLFDAYCEWLFTVLFELEKRLDTTDYNAYSARVFGFVSERLLDVWIETNGVAYTELPVLHTESQHWLRKGTKFVLRKFGYQTR